MRKDYWFCPNEECEKHGILQPIGSGGPYFCVSCGIRLKRLPGLGNHRNLIIIGLIIFLSLFLARFAWLSMSSVPVREPVEQNSLPNASAEELVRAPVAHQPDASPQQPIVVEPEVIPEPTKPETSIEPTDEPSISHVPSTRDMVRQSVRIRNKLGMEFVFCPPGEFMMGVHVSEPGWNVKDNQHNVKLTKGFYIQNTEVTQDQWKMLMGTNPSFYSGCGDNCPVEQVSWDDCRKYIERINKIDPGKNYRLPTEAEWEYACRADTASLYSWGNGADCYKANFGNSIFSQECNPINAGRPRPVASYPPNAWGLYDMHGNVLEWCQDWHAAYNAQNGQTDPTGPSSGSFRICRGGGWYTDAGYVRSAARTWNNPAHKGNGLGFRLAFPAVG